MTPAELRRAALKERARRIKKAGPPKVDIDRVCHRKQAALVRAIVSGKVRSIACKAGRQSGKSHGGALATDIVMSSRPGVNWLYVTSTFASCRKMAFLPAVALNSQHNLGGDPHFAMGQMDITYPNGSIAYFMGADNERTIERLKGTPNLAGCIIDEAGLYASDKLRLMIETVRPGLRPLAGVLAVMGNPSTEGKQGTWYDITENAHYDQHRFDYLDNDKVPSFADVEKLIDEELAAMFPHLTPAQRRATAYFLREYKGEFVVDLAEKVYQITDANLVDDIPEDLEVFLSAGDLGVSANDALVSLGWRDDAAEIYVADQEEESGQDTLAYADMVKAHDARRHPLEIAVDPGGLGQKTIKTVQNLFPEVPITEATKGPIGIQVRAVNTLAQNGRLKIKRGSKLALELASPTWVGGIVGGEIDEHGKHSDLVPSLRYACIRALVHLPHLKQPPSAEEVARERYREGVERAVKQARRQGARDHTYEPDEFLDDLSDDLDQ